MVHGGIHSQASTGEAFSRQTRENARVKDEHVEKFRTLDIVAKDVTSGVKLEDLHPTETQVCLIKPL